MADLEKIFKPRHLKIMWFHYRVPHVTTQEIAEHGGLGRDTVLRYTQEIDEIIQSIPDPQVRFALESIMDGRSCGTGKIFIESDHEDLRYE
jgi:hypothetical protein